MKESDQNRIVQIPMMSSNAYVVANGRNAILIDAGMNKKGRKILAALEGMHLSPQDIRLIIPTHTTTITAGGSML